MKRTIAIALSAATICGVIMTAGCGKNKPTGNHTSGSTSSSVSQTEGMPMLPDASDGSISGDGQPQETDSSPPPTPLEEDPAAIKPSGFENLSFGGRTFTIAAASGTDPRWESAKEIYSDGADAVSTAVRERNAVVESLYDCKIKIVATEDPAGLAMAEVTANTHNVDIFSATGFGKSLSESGNIYNLYSIGVDFSREWWDPTFVSAYTVKTESGTDTLFAAMGDFCLSALAATHAIIFNRDVLASSPTDEDVYELVRRKEWTMDKFAEMIRTAAKDVSGNSAIAFEDGDVLGWARTGHATHGLHTASALSIVETKNGAFLFSPAGDPAAWTSVIDKAIGVWNTVGAQTLGYTSVQKAIASGKALFASEVIDVLERMKDAEDADIGVLPYPLYSPLQERYAHYVDNHVFTYHVPVSVSDTDAVGNFLEVFGYHSRHTVREAFINVYAYDYCSDPNAAEMLRIILDSRTYDPGYHYWSAAEGDLSNMIASSNNNVVQWTEKRKNSLAADIGSYVGKISEAKS